MMIHVAESGQSFELEDCQAGTRVEEIQDVLASLTGVLRQDQLLFSGDARLDSHRSLGFYRLPDDERPIFLFNRQRLAPNSPLPPQQGAPENVVPVLPEAPAAERSGSSSPLVSSERQFRYNFQKGHAILSASQKKLDACHKLAREIRVQDMALETVRRSMEQHYRSIQHVYGEFVEDFQRQSQQHTEVLANLGKDIERLRACKLHPALRTETRYTLLDCVKEGSLRKSADDCGVYHKQLCTKVAGLASEYSGLKRRVEDFLEEPSAVSLENLERTLGLHARFIDEQSTILQSLRKDVTKVKRLSDDYSDGRYSSMQVQDALLALGPMHDVQVKSHLPRMEDCDAELAKLLQQLVVGKNAMTLCVHQRMQSVASLQASIKLTRNQISGFREVMARQDENFEMLKQFRRVGSSYKACLAEVVRRKSYMKLYLGQAGQLAERMAAKREKEVVRREEFLQTHTAALPRELLSQMGLLEVPSQFLINLASFDSNLLDIDLADVEKYAPYQVTGSLKADSPADDWGDPEGKEDFCTDEISGTSKLEVENARLRAQLAASIAFICSIDPGFQPDILGDAEDQEIRGNLSSAERTAEALRLKDEHAKHLHRIITEKEGRCSSYESRIRELEDRLREQEERERTDLDTMVSSEDQRREESDNSAITGAAVEPMDGATGQEDSSAQSEEAKNQHPVKDVFSQTREWPADEPVLSEVVRLREELETSAELLRQCQMNSAHLENRLHEAREEAQIHLCAADRRASEYNVLRASSVKLRGLLERLRSCIASPAGGPAGFMDSLRSLSASLPSDGGDDVGAEFRSFISILADRVTFLAQQRAELAERVKLAESSQSQLRKEVENKAEMAKSLFAKCKLEKQASKEKICLTRFEVHELALFAPNAAGHYEALNRNCPNYFLSEESIALFHGKNEQRRKYIVGQIVHIEHHTVAAPPGASSSSFSILEGGASSSSSVMGRHRANSYELPVGTEYWVVTVAMVPGLDL
ncbi:hypothetical protein SELMODRAFT_79145 [Selaginella moellendorffii]|uniref:Uncharacterized protein n=1 Tax=Selaginella moellendorffii TaxID=88036 RepID=D8QU95_SELML|nr:autophagy-related protein 11 [Selaginella moellendorffii]EFJ36260.1 hypothetical protein SELMODRAFT_79145 [Selaginella moellendorffii]|eukprot:XP_002962797.1 autophagy-related protein 11 [Selaginella moellendorffii]